MAVYVGLPRLLTDVGGSDAVAPDYNLSENRRLIGIIMAHNLTYNKYDDYYIMKIAIRCWFVNNYPYSEIFVFASSHDFFIIVGNTI